MNSRETRKKDRTRRMRGLGTVVLGRLARFEDSTIAICLPRGRLGPEIRGRTWSTGDTPNRRRPWV